MTEVHHFAYGWFSPALAYALSFLGSLAGLSFTARARAAGRPRPGSSGVVRRAGSHGRSRLGRGHRTRWLVLAAVSIGGAGIWLMHFMAMLGFDVPDSPVRYDPARTLLSMIIAIGACGFGLFMVGGDRPGRYRILTAGAITGIAVAAMHYTGMAALRVAGTIRYDPGLVAASVIIAVVAATVALLFTIAARRPGHIVGAALIMAVAVCGMHYTGMAATRVELSDSFGAVSGVSPLLLIIPMTLITSAGLLGMALSGLQAMTAEEFGLPAPPPPARPAQPVRLLSPR